MNCDLELNLDVTFFLEPRTWCLGGVTVFGDLEFLRAGEGVVYAISQRVQLWFVPNSTLIQKIQFWDNFREKNINLISNFVQKTLFWIEFCWTKSRFCSSNLSWTLSCGSSWWDYHTGPVRGPALSHGPMCVRPSAKFYKTNF